MRTRTVPGTLNMLLFCAHSAAYGPAGTPDDWAAPMHEPGPYSWLLIDRLEAGITDGADTYAWDAQGWYGGDRNRLWLKSEGSGDFSKSPEDAELQVLYSRLIAPYWDWQIGVRHDFAPQPERSHAVLGLQGLVPYAFEVDSAVFLSDAGDLSTRFEVEYEFRLTQRLVLQPRFELNAAASKDTDTGKGRGINATALGLRMRYEFRREFAPYIGVEWEQLYGTTKRMARDDGEHGSVALFVAGVRFWF
jgi:copper resistance protein B